MRPSPLLERTSWEALIFDFDGVILESTEIKTDAFAELFADYPEHREAIRQHHVGRLGISRHEKFDWIYRELLKQPLPAAEKQRLDREFSRLVLHRVLRCPFVPGAREALEAWHRRVPLFIASGTPQAELALVLRERDIAKYLAGAWGAPTSKPDIIRAALTTHRLDPAHVLFVGDGASDFEAAVAIGLQFLARRHSGVQHDWEALGVAAIPDLWPVARLARSSARGPAAAPPRA